MDENKKLWDRCVAFHGHVCGGLTIGYKAALYAIELLDLTFSEDEDVVCITENDACGVDAIQVILGCSAGKGNLIFKIRGKQAFSFYNRTNGKSVRLVLKARPKMTKEESKVYMMEHTPSELFDIKEANILLPERARIFNSYPCEICGEVTAESMMRLEDEKKVCLDCAYQYSRFI
jgi:formylmethanofuran dehydrogenase subunit E